MPHPSRWLLFAVVFVVSCGEAGARPEPPPPPVRVQTVALESRSPVTRVTAPVQAERRATLRAEATGRVAEAPFRRGAAVEEGEVILRLSVPRSQNAVTEAQASVDQLRASLRQATRQREHAEQLASENASTSSNVDSARDREAEAQARLDAALARARSARAGVNETVLRAPFAGVLASFSVNVGDSLRPGAEVGILVDTEALEAELLLDATEARETAVGSPVAITADGHALTGRVTLVGEVLDPRTRRLPVRVAIGDPDHRLLPGGVAAFEVPVGPPREVALLPERAVVQRLGLDQVFVVVEGDIAEAREVTLGEVRGARVEVLTGLVDGDRAIVGGNERVVSGQPVQVVDDEGE